MKKIFLILTILCTFKMYSQLSLSCNYKELRYWSETKETFEDGKAWEENSLFEINKNQTMITHTTDEGSSTYYIKSSSYEDDIMTATFQVVSDNGNKYVMFFDAKNRLIKVIGADEILIIFYVKSTFKL